MDIISLGEALIDFTPGGEEGSFIRNPGGAPANFAVSAARNGLSAAFLGRLGMDDFGKFMIRILEENKVKVLLPELLDEAVTTMAFVSLYEGGERSFTFARKPGADMLLKPEDITGEMIKQCRLLHAGSFSLSERPSRDATVYALILAKEFGKLVSFDVNYRAMIWKSKKEAENEVNNILPYVDLLKISEEELDFVGGEDNIYSVMRQNHISVVVETLGAQGARYFFHNTSDQVIGRKVNAIDATGAGDAFWGGFIAKLLLDGVNRTTDITEDKLKSAMEYGNISGSLCVQRMGGIPALPTRTEIEAVL